MTTALRASFLFFDLDGTLVDSAEAIRRAWEEWAEKHRIAEPSLVNALGGTSFDTVRSLLPASEVQAAHASITQFEIQTASIIREVPGAGAVLRDLPAGRWGMVTSSRRAVSLVKLQAAGLPTPEVLVTADDYQRGKPAPDPYYRALEAAASSPAACLTFEDSNPGIQSAVAAGIRVVGIATYQPPLELQAELCVHTWSDVQVSSSRDGDLLIQLADSL